MKKIGVAVFLLFLIPAFANAAWWNPLSWTWNPAAWMADLAVVLHPPAKQAVVQDVEVPATATAIAAPPSPQPVIATIPPPATSTPKVQAVAQAPSPVPLPSTPPPAPAPTSTPASAPIPTVEPRDITAKANVGLLCHYKSNDPAITALYSDFKDANGDLVIEKASGVIIDPQGYILTAKHLVDSAWVNVVYASSTDDSDMALNNALTLDYCDVGVPTVDVLPTVADIENNNPSISVMQPFSYVAKPYYEPGRGKLNDDEYTALDFAVLKITGPSPNCKTFNTCVMPSSFPYNPVLYTSVPETGYQLLDYGYPGEVINSYGIAFSDLYLHGAVGRMGAYHDASDTTLQNQDISFSWSASDVLEGRSGSPVYWQGYVVGIEYAGNIENTTKDYAVGMPAIYANLENAGMENILSTN